jgi:hypothetical protein
MLQQVFLAHMACMQQPGRAWHHLPLAALQLYLMNCSLPQKQVELPHGARVQRSRSHGGTQSQSCTSGCDTCTRTEVPNGKQVSSWHLSSGQGQVQDLQPDHIYGVKSCSC